LGGGERLVIGGKSMGGRFASMVADEAGARALVCLGYPFHPPGQPEKLRVAHLEHLHTPALIIQGTRDPFGTREDVAGYTLSPSIQFLWLEDGDHSFKPRASSGKTERGHLEEAVRAVAELAKASG
jgi:predicted alpha/beta-hydrolase family hydrolase